MKALVCLLVAVTYWVQAQAQTDSIVYGLNIPYPPQDDIYFSKMDPATGNISLVSSIPVSTYYVFSGSTIDVHQEKYYFVSGLKFMGVDLHTGLVTSDPWINNTNGARFEYCIYNCKDSCIYGLVSNTPRNELRLGKINPLTGTVTNISPASIGNNYLMGGYTLDPDKGIYYFLSDQHEFTGVDIHSGVVVSQVTVTGFDEYVEFAYNCRDSIIYGLARNATAVAEVYLAGIDPLTGTLDMISPAPFDISFQLDGVTIDPYRRRYYVGTPMFVFSSVDMNTGNVLTAAPMTSPVGGYFGGQQCRVSCCDVTVAQEKPENALWPEIPNVFTPNGDGINDIIRLSFPGPVQVYIYNRWGQQVYVSEGKRFTWEGKNAAGEKLSEGTYYLLMEEMDENTKAVKTGKSILLTR